MTIRRAGFLVQIWLLAVAPAAAPSAADVDLPAPLTSVGSQSKETELGDLVADALHAAGEVDAAILPAGSLKETTFPTGRLNTDQLLTCLQYPSDKTAVLELTGEQVLQALERSVGIYPQKNLGFLQVSGLTFSFDPNARKGSRVSSAKIGKRGVHAARKYRVITTVPLARGGHGYFTIWGKDSIKEFRDVSVADAVTRFLRHHARLDYRDAKRITAKGK